MTPEEQKAFKELKAEIKALQRVLSNKEKELTALRTKVDDIQRAHTMAMALHSTSDAVSARGALERWIRKHGGTAVIHVNACDRPLEIGVQVTLPGGQCDFRGEGLTMDEAFQDGLSRRIRAIREEAEDAVQALSE